MWRRHHRAQRRLDRSLWIGQEISDAGEGLVFLGIEHMQDGADEQRVARLFPVVSFLQCAFGIDQHVGDVLDVSDFPLAAADLEQWVVSGALRVRRIEQQYIAEPRAPPGREPPVLTLDIMDDGGARPGHQRRHDQANALARSCWRKAQDMLRPMVAEIGATPAAEKNAVRMKKSRLANLARFSPSRGPIGRDLLHFARTPDRHGDRHHEGSDTAGACNEAASDEDLVGVSIVSNPPPKEGRWLVDRPAEEHEPGTAKLRLEGELPSRPLCCRPHKDEDGSADEKDLDPEDFGRVHRDE